MGLSELVGKTVDHYRINREIGHGGAAHVFSAYDTESRQEVAFKAITIQTEDRVAFMQRFLREVDAISTLNHPNIVKVYGAGEKDEFVYIALQLIEGDTLRERIASQRLTTQAACQYVIQIARALQEAHSKGIIHRDVKPSNILLDSHHPGKALLTDFGTAKIQNATGLTKTGSTLGTPEYMSPEQAEGRREVDQRSDIYSLGCTLYEALAGRPPFVGSNAMSILYQHVNVPPTYIRSFNTQTPRELWQVLHTCLAKRPDDRYGSAARLAEELQPFADGLIQPTPTPWPVSITGRPVADGVPGFAAPSRPLRQEPPVPIVPPVAPPVVPPVVPPVGSKFTLNPYDQNVVQWIAPQGDESIEAQAPRIETERAPNSQPTTGPAADLSRLRGTTGGPGLLSGRLGLTPEAKQAIAAWEAQLQQPALGQIDQRVTEKSLAAGGPSLDDAATVPTPITHAPPLDRAPMSGGRTPSHSMPIPPTQRARTSGPFYATSDPAAGIDDQPPYNTPMGYSGRASGPLTPQRAHTSGPRLAQASQPMHPPIAAAPITFADLEHQRPSPRRRTPTLLVATLGAALLAGGLMFGMSSLKLFANQAVPPHATQAHPTATHKPATPTVAPTVTPAPPAATATPNPQAQLDRQAADAFRSITVASYSDGSCSGKSATTQFAGGAPIFINFCMAYSSAPGPVTVTVRQNGATVRTLISSQYTHPGSFYSAGHTLSNGSYDMVVTMTINGNQATAATIPFTVG